MNLVHLAVQISMKSRRRPKAAQGAPKGPQAAKKGPQRTAKGAQRQGPGQIKIIPWQIIYWLFNYRELNQWAGKLKTCVSAKTRIWLVNFQSNSLFHEKWIWPGICQSDSRFCWKSRFPVILFIDSILCNWIISSLFVMESFWFDPGLAFEALWLSFVVHFWPPGVPLERLGLPSAVF